MSYILRLQASRQVDLVNFSITCMIEDIYTAWYVDIKPHSVRNVGF